MLQFIKEYIQHPLKIGAIAPSSKYLAQKMIHSIDFESSHCIVEYGPGTGVFTKEIIRRKKKDTIFLIVEANQVFYDKLVEQYSGISGVILVHGSAEKIKTYLEKLNIGKVDYIISGLPFASLPKEITGTILEETKRILAKEGEFITFQYSMVKRGLFEQYFEVKEYKREYRNLPPAYVVRME